MDGLRKWRKKALSNRESAININVLSFNDPSSYFAKTTGHSISIVYRTGGTGHSDQGRRHNSCYGLSNCRRSTFRRSFPGSVPGLPRSESVAVLSGVCTAILHQPKQGVFVNGYVDRE